MEPGERPENLYQRLVGFIDDNLLKANSNIQHYGENVTTDQEVTTSIDNMIVLTWLRLIHTDLPALVKQRYGTELRSQTLATLKPEISQALDTLLDEINSTNETKVLRTAFRRSSHIRDHPIDQQKTMNTKRNTTKTCPLCKQANRPKFQHYQTKCPYPPTEDQQYLTRTPQALGEYGDTTDESDQEQERDDVPSCHNCRVKSTTCRVSTKRSPHLKVFHQHHAIYLTLDTGAETSMIKTSVANQVGATIQNTKQTTLQADGTTPLTVVGEVHLTLSRSHLKLQLDALVVDDLDVDVLARTPFMITNDISVRPSRQRITIMGSKVIYYGSKSPESTENHIRRTQAFVIRARSSPTVV